MDSLVMKFLEAIAVIIVFTVGVWIIFDVVVAIDKKIKQKRKKQALERYNLSNDKIWPISERIISKHVRDNKEKEKKKEKYEQWTKEELKKHSILHNIIVRAWQKKEEESIWSPVRIAGKNEQEKISIEVRGKRGDVSPCEAIISLDNIPGFKPYVYKELIEFSAEEEEKIENWIIFNTTE